MRFKNRYLLVRLVWKDGKAAEGLNEMGLLKALRDAVEAQDGDLGLGSSLQSMQVKWYSPFSRLAVVRCDREACKQVCAAMRQMKDIQFRRASVEPAHIHGTIQACQRHALLLNASALKATPPVALHHRQVAALLEERLLARDL